MDKFNINRRTFLHKALISASAFSLIGCGGSGSAEIPTNVPPPPPPSQSDVPGSILSVGAPIQSIVIIGAGISGLVAGYELSLVGHQVTFLEARARSGGRVNTLYSPFAAGQFAESGASRIPSDHNLTLGYVDHFGLSLEQFYANVGSYFALNNNQLSLTDAADYISQPPWTGSVNRSAYSKISGGMSGLPNAFIDFFNGNINYSQAVEFIVQNNDNVEITTTTGDVYIADRVLCTAPLPVLNKIQFTPPLSTDKTTASNGGYHYTDSSRLYTQFSERFWENNNLNGWGNTDLPEEIWQPSWADGGTKGIIQSYLRGTPAQQFDALSPQQQIANVHNRWRSALPNLDDFVENNVVYAWANEQWSGSAYASPTAQEEAALKPSLSVVEGRLHFSGEHTSNFEGWIQGALESGIRAAKEIHNSG